MRRLKWWHWLLLGCILVGMAAALVVLLAFAPGIQRRVFLAALEAPGRTVEVARFSAGFGGVEIEGLSWTEDGRRLVVRDLDARFSLMAALGSGPFDIDALELHGLQADVSERAEVPAGASGTPAADATRGRRDEARAPGELAISLPADITIRHLVVEGTLISTGGTQIAVELRGESLRAEGVVGLSWRTRNLARAPDAAATETDPHGEFQVRSSVASDSGAVVAGFHDVLRLIAREPASRR